MLIRALYCLFDLYLAGFCDNFDQKVLKFHDELLLYIFSKVKCVKKHIFRCLKPTNAGRTFLSPNLVKF